MTSEEGEVRVLLVDDQAPFLAAARGLVSRVPGFAVVGEATGGAEAVALAAATRPDLVLMDIRMPEVDGIAACRQITTADPAPVVVLLSTYDRGDLPDDVSTSGAAAYLHKEELTPGALVGLWAEHGRRLGA